MPITICEPVAPVNMSPLTASKGVVDVSLGRDVFYDALMTRLGDISETADVTIAANFWPSIGLLQQVAHATESLNVVDAGGNRLLSCAFKVGVEASEQIVVDDESIIVHYAWDLLAVNENYLGNHAKTAIDGTIREGATIDGIVELGKGSVVLPGVYIEGTVVIGENCTIGPNCYIRGVTSIGDHCRIGQSVEVKNSIIMPSTAVCHLSYVGDSILGESVNLGAGTITANFRHDGANHRSLVGAELIDTGRRKFGTVIGNNAHTGIHTSIYPGRKIAEGASTRPGDVVSKDITDADC